MPQPPHLRWRWYRTAAGNAPVKEFLDDLAAADRAAVVAVMHDIQHEGLAAGRHLRGDLWELRAIGMKAHYRLIFSREGRRVLLALDIFDKDTQRTPANVIRRSEQRLMEWRARASR